MDCLHTCRRSSVSFYHSHLELYRQIKYQISTATYFRFGNHFEIIFVAFTDKFISVNGVRMHQKKKIFVHLCATRHTCVKTANRSTNEWECNLVVRPLTQHYSHSTAAVLSLLIVFFSPFSSLSISIRRTRRSNRAVRACFPL